MSDTNPTPPAQTPPSAVSSPTQPATQAPKPAAPTPPQPVTRQVNQTNTPPSSTNPPQNPTPQPANQPQQASQAQSVQTETAEANPSPVYESAATIKSRTKRLVVISSVLILALFAADIGIIYFTRGRLATLELNKQQIISTQANNQYLEQASGFVANRQEQLEYILSALPTDSTLVEFIRSVEIVAQEHSASSTIDFDARAPSGADGEKYIPIKIKLSTDPQNFEAFLTKVEKLPYLLQVTGIEATRISGSDNIWQYTLQSRVFVRDDFYQQE